MTPIATIAGSNTGLNLPGGVALDKGGNIYVASQSIVTVYAPGSNDNVSPKVTFAQGAGGSAIALDSSANIYLAQSNNAVQVYSAGSHGTVAPIVTIMGSNTRLFVPEGIAIGP